MTLILPLFVSFFLSFNALASDEEREQRLVQEVLAGILDGEPIFLTTKKGTPFLSLLTKSEDKTKGVVLVIHGRGLHANWHNVAQPVRTLLPEYGWDTLSIQMPVLEKEAVFDDYVDILPESPPRIEIALSTLKSMGYQKIIIASHSCGGQMMLQWLENQQDPSKKIDGLINISLGIGNYKRVHGHYPPLDQLNIPVLDIYGSEDIVKDLSLARWALTLKAGHKDSKQVELEGAEHMYIDKGEALTEEISQWLQSLE